MFDNECLDTKNFFTRNDIELIQSGDCDNHTLDLKRSVEESDSSVKNPKVQKTDPLVEEKRYRRVTWEEFSRAVLIVGTEKLCYQSNNQIIFILALQIFATIGIYLTICFVIFLIIAWMSKRNSMRTPSNISFDCTGSKTPVSFQIMEREVDEEAECKPYPEPEEENQGNDDNMNPEDRGRNNN